MPKRLTEEEIRLAAEEIDEDTVDDIEDEDMFLQSDIEDSQNNENIEDDASEMSDTISDIEEDAGEEYGEIFVGKDGTQWYSIPKPQRRIPARNIIRCPLNKVNLPPGKQIEDPLEAIELYLNDEIFDSIVKFTNLYAVTTNQNAWRPTNVTEIRAYVGLLITAGTKKEANTEIAEFWSSRYGCPIFRATMSRNRFMEISKNLRFDDKSTRSIRQQKDKLAPVRDLFEIVNKNLKKFYTPGDNLTVDEQLVPFRGRCSFRQYMPSKPDKYGLKIWWVCDSKTAYPLNAIPYLGKINNQRGFGLGQRVVEELVQPYENTGRNITCDNYFTSLELANNLLAKGLTITGTLKKNKRCVPSSFLPNRKRQVETNLFGFTNNKTLVSYVPKPNRAVLLLSTMHYDTHCDSQNKNKSEVNLHYNRTKGAVDTLDQLAHSFTCRRKSNRWPFTFFSNLIDVCAIAAYIIWKNLHPSWKATQAKKARKLFLREVAEGLIAPQIHQRSRNKLQRPIVQCMEKVLQEGNTPSTTTSTTNKRKRCYMCDPKISRIIKQCCQICKNNVCNEHATKVINCKECIQ